MLQPVAIGVLEVNDHDVGRNLGDAARRFLAGIEHRHQSMAGLAQPILDDLRTDSIFIDDEDGEVVSGHGAELSSCLKTVQYTFLHIDCAFFCSFEAPLRLAVRDGAH